MVRTPALAGPAAPFLGRLQMPALVALGLFTALLLGIGAGYPSAGTLLPAGVVAGLWIIGLTLWRPFAGLMVVVASLFMLIIVQVSGGKGLNAFDLFLWPVIAATVLGSARQAARLADRETRGPRHAAIDQGAAKLRRATWVFYGLMILSVGQIVLHGHPEIAGTSLLKIFRALMGVMMFALGIWWLRTERQIRMATWAMLIGGAVFAIVNTIGIVVYQVPRAGLIWIVNASEWPIDSPNEAGPAMLMLVGLLLARQLHRPQARNIVMIAIAVIMLVLTFSRSGLLAFVVFAALTLPIVGWRRVLVALLCIAAALPLVPMDYWTRMWETITLKQGSFATYSSLIRVYSWDAGLRMLLDYPITGVGFLGFATVSSRYNQLGLVLGGVEQYFLEVAVGMGIIGLVALCVVLSRLYRLGRIVRRETPPGSMGHAMARVHAPLLTGLLTACLTGDNFVSMVGVGQLAFWTALMVRAGHASVEEPRETAAA